MISALPNSRAVSLVLIALALAGPLGASGCGKPYPDEPALVTDPEPNPPDPAPPDPPPPDPAPPDPPPPDPAPPDPPPPPPPPPPDPGPICEAEPLPLYGDEDGPVVTDVRLVVRAEGIALYATVTDPQGSENIRGNQQAVGVFESWGCNAISFDLVANFSNSGREKSLGIVVDVTVNPVLYAEIAAASTWPVHVDFVDDDGHRTSGRVEVRVSR